MAGGKPRSRRSSRPSANYIFYLFVRFSMMLLLIAPSLFFLYKTNLLFLIFPSKNSANSGSSTRFINHEKQSYQHVPLLDKPRLPLRTLLSVEQQEGAGALVRRSIGRPELKQLDPFLLLDHFAVSPPAGFPDHPHRGFETVTYMLEGAFTHQDFDGHKGTIGPGDLQYFAPCLERIGVGRTPKRFYLMIGSRGIVHCELPAMKGIQRGVQLWVNLPSRFKMVEPKYQELNHINVAKVEKDGVKVSIIAGESFGIKSPVYTLTPIMFLDFTLQPGSQVHQAVPEGWNAFVYVLDGQPTLGTEAAVPVKAYHTVQLGPGNSLNVWNTRNMICRFLLIGGEPLNEPVVQHGPFVMNTQEEIRQAVHDYQTAQNGFEKARTWHSTPPAFD